MESLFDRLKTFCLARGFNNTYWIAFSGGLDSCVLLHLAARLSEQYPLKIHAIHVHHGLSLNADAWRDHCVKRCSDMQIPLIAQSIDLDIASGQSKENLARDGRYAVFSAHMQPNDLLLTAHHQDDQAETVLLQLLRGAGPKGLAAMPIIKPFGAGFHGRPLLNATRAELTAYAIHHGLQWIDDESNRDCGYTRNFLRHEILPILSKRWPSVTTTLARSAEHCAEMQQLVDDMTAVDLQHVRLEKNSLSIPVLLTLSAARQRQVLRAWLTDLQFPVPSTAKLRDIQERFLSAASDRSPHITWRNIELRRYQQSLYAMPCLPSVDHAATWQWDVHQSLMIPGWGVLINPGFRADVSTVTVRFRQGGEWCQLPGRTHRHALKNLLQTWKIPPWLRERIPLIFADGLLIAIPGYYLHEAYSAIPVMNNGDV